MYLEELNCVSSWVVVYLEMMLYSEFHFNLFFNLAVPLGIFIVPFIVGSTRPDELVSIT